MPDLGRFSSITLESILEVVRNPTSNLTAAAFLGAAFLLMLLILVLVAWLFMLTTDADGSAAIKGKRAADGAADRPARRRTMPRWVRLIAPGVIVVAMCAGAYSSGRDAHCLGCHETSNRPQELSARHARCVSCHERGVLFAPSIAATRLRMEFSRVRGTSQPVERREAVVDNSNCLRCHRVDDMDSRARATAEASGSVGVLMSHAEPEAAGIRCVECHGATGAHAEADSEGSHPTMRLCIDCHDGTRASAECATCHIGDPVDAVRVEPTPIEKTRLVKPVDCSGCHDLGTCDACHGIRLPHSTGFVQGDHASEAAFRLRQHNCSKCHSGAWCLDTCHTNGNRADPDGVWSHPPDWARSHAAAPESTCGGCHSPRINCVFCHR